MIIESFLRLKIYKIKIEDKFFITRIVKASIPQGSELSPTYFLIYTNDIPDYEKLNEFKGESQQNNHDYVRLNQVTPYFSNCSSKHTCHVITLSEISRNYHWQESKI